MQHINKVSLKNFKFFLGEEVINFDKKNLLLYGENGGGKSSLYWGLYTFLQSVFKSEPDDISKYFDRTRAENLVNIFSDPTESSHIVVEYIADDGTLTTKEISLHIQNTTTGNLVKEMAYSSDFVNYRLLSRMYDFSNSKQIDLFQIFDAEVLPYISLSAEFTAGNNNAKDWWNFINEGPVPRPNINTQEYRDFQHLVGVFNTHLSNYLQSITQSANEHLQQNFKQPLELRLVYENASYNDFVENSTTRRTHKTKAPKILLTVSYLHDKLAGAKKDLNRPQTFLNEARLTAIALSIRLSILDEKYIANSPKILVLDDLLLSLDMSNRDIVLDLVLNTYNSYQLIILTHDSSFFNMIKRRLDAEGITNNWMVKEIYQEITSNGIPKPFLPESANYLDQAKKYLNRFEYPAAANCLRKEAERLLKHLLPPNKIIVISKDDSIKEAQLDTLIENFKQYYEGLGGDFRPFLKLKEYKDLLLNPLSHDNIDTPVYRKELDGVFQVIDELKTLKTCVIQAVNVNQNMVLEETDHAGVGWTYTIEILENFRALRLLDGSWKITDPKCIFKTRQNNAGGAIEKLNYPAVKLSKGYDQIMYKLEIKGIQAPKPLTQIMRTFDNILVSEITT